MSRKDKQAKRPLVWGVVGGLGVILAVIKLAPDGFLVEAIVFGVFLISEYLILSWFGKNRRRAIAISVLTGGALLLNRLGILDILTGILLVIITLLISISN
jgi:hypothetical protein